MPGIKEVASQGLEFIGSVFGLRWGTEEPRFTVVDTIRGDGAEVQIRRYEDRVAAETTVEADEDSARSIGFRRLAGYIFGDNRGEAKIAMTAPVAQQESTIRFFTPAKWTLETLPAPNDGRVRLVKVPGETVAVLTFSGDRSPAEVARRTEVLRRIVAGSSHRPAGEPVAWFYDPPFTLPFRRRNEVVLPVED